MVGAPELHSVLFFAQSNEPTIPQPLRAILLMALLGIVLIGLLLVVSTMLGAHWVRRLGRYRRGPAVPTDVSPLRSDSSQQADAGPSNELPEERVDTVISHDRPSHDTNHSP